MQGADAERRAMRGTSSGPDVPRVATGLRRAGHRRSSRLYQSDSQPRASAARSSMIWRVDPRPTSAANPLPTRIGSTADGGSPRFATIRSGSIAARGSRPLRAAVWWWSDISGSFIGSATAASQEHGAHVCRFVSRTAAAPPTGRRA
jgi:hypothetical protein